MSEKQNIKEQPEEEKLPTIKDSENPVEGTLLSSEEKKSLSEENIENTTPHIQPNSESMEVHHPHHPTHKKKWTEYLLEFLMLFLAVFLGFTAENIREHQVERHREADYIKGIIQNLKDDTAHLSQVIPLYSQRTLNLDSIFKMSKADLSEPENLIRITRLNSRVAFWGIFKANTATISQLKAGNLRLIQRRYAADSILRYDLMNQNTEEHREALFYSGTKYLEQAQNVFDFSVMRDSSFKKGMLNGKLPPALGSDKKNLELYFNSAVINWSASDGYVRLLSSQLKYARRLMAYLKKEYHLEDE